MFRLFTEVKVPKQQCQTTLLQARVQIAKINLSNFVFIILVWSSVLLLEMLLLLILWLYLCVFKPVFNKCSKFSCHWHAEQINETFLWERWTEREMYSPHLYFLGNFVAASQRTTKNQYTGQWQGTRLFNRHSRCSIKKSLNVLSWKQWCIQIQSFLFNILSCLTTGTW